jgi:hypothetical protein
MGHWAKAFMTLWPLWALLLGTLGYTNKDEIKQWYSGPPPDAPGAVQQPSNESWEVLVNKAIADLIAENKARKAETADALEQIEELEKLHGF